MWHTAVIAFWNAEDLSISQIVSVLLFKMIENFLKLYHCFPSCENAFFLKWYSCGAVQSIAGHKGFKPNVILIYENSYKTS